MGEIMKNNFKNSYTDLTCQLGCTESDEQPHLFECEILLNKCKHLSENVHIEYEDIFEDERKQINAVKLLKHILQTRKKILSKNQ